MEVNRYAAAMERLARRRGVGWTGRFAPVGQEIIHYVEAGSGHPLVLLHGLAAWSYTWRKNIPALSREMKTYALDLPGFGLSTKTRRAGYSLWDQARHVLAWMDAVGLERVVLAGHSMGGEIALRLATLAPERVAALLLVASAGYAVTSLPREARLALRVPGLGLGLIRYFFFNQRFTRAALRAARHDPAGVTEADVAAYLLPARTPGATRTFLRLLREIDFGSFAPRIGEVRQPALLVWGARDPWTPLAHGERMARELAGARLHVFPQAAHMPHEEHPDEFHRLVLGWLAELGYSAAPR